MALINCKECGKEISDTAVRCPNCGCKTAHGEGQTEAKAQLVGWVINVGLMIIGAILFLGNISEFLDGAESSYFWRALKYDDDVQKIVYSTLIGASMLIGGICGISALNNQLKKEELAKKVALITEPLPGEEIVEIERIPESKQEVGTCQKCGKDAVVALCRVREIPHDYKLCRACINKYGATIK